MRRCQTVELALSIYHEFHKTQSTIDNFSLLSFLFFPRKTIDSYVLKMKADGIEDLGPVYIVMKKLLDKYDALKS